MALPKFDPSSPILDAEQLARFVLYKSHVRIDGTLKQDAFIPHPYTDLSTTRHDLLGERKIWIRGNNVARQQKLPLIGRGDVCASVYRSRELQIVRDPIDCNPQHVNIGPWPSDKPAQKNRAQLIAKDSVFRPFIEIADTEASTYIGDFVVVNGFLAQVVTSQRANMFLNFGSPYPNQSLTAWIQRGAPILGELEVIALQGQRIRVTGKIEVCNSKPQIRVSLGSQISSP